MSCLVKATGQPLIKSINDTFALHRLRASFITLPDWHASSVPEKNSTTAARWRAKRPAKKKPRVGAGLRTKGIQNTVQRLQSHLSQLNAALPRPPKGERPFTSAQAAAAAVATSREGHRPQRSGRERRLRGSQVGGCVLYFGRLSQLRKLPRSRKACQRCLLASFRLAS